jgi:hypothetical protein
LKKTIQLIIIFIIIIIGVSIFQPETEAASSPYAVESSVQNSWNTLYGSKDYSWESGRRLVYDIYKSKYLSNGWTTVNKNFNGTTKKYLQFHGWAVLSGYKKHTASNHSTHIVLKKVSGNSGVGTTKIYNTIPINIDATKDLEYNSQTTNPSSVWNECPSTATNKNNTTCNMRYEDVGFTAYIPLEEIFPNAYENAKWEMYLVKRVDSQIVYSPLVVPFEFNDLSHQAGKLTLSSGIDSEKLIMNDYPVIRRTYARQPASQAANVYFRKGSYYHSVKMNESSTAIWYGVRTPEDNNNIRWGNTTYWTFGGSKAILSYAPTSQPKVETTVTVTPSEIRQNQYRDENISVNVKGVVTDIYDSSQIAYYQFIARPIDDTSAYLTNTITTSSTKSNMSFTFTIPKSKIGTSGSHIQEYIGRVRVYMKDGSYITSTDTDIVVIYPPSPPTAGFYTNKSNYWIGDKVSVTNTAISPTGDPLTYEYIIQRPNGTTFTYSTSNGKVQSNGNFSFKTNGNNPGYEVGTWRITQTIRNPYGLSDTISKTFFVHDLSIRGSVYHTPEWQSKHNNKGNPWYYFYSGEEFRLDATVSTAPISWVKVDFQGYQKSGNLYTVGFNLGKISSTVYRGMLNEPAFIKNNTALRNGYVTFNFTVQYQNGTVRTNTVNVQIIGTVFEAFAYHRRY